MKKEFKKDSLKKRKNKGFTLLEILLVIAAIGILAAIVIVAINPLRQIGKVRQAERASEINQLNKAIEQYYIAEGKYPDALTSIVGNSYGEVCNTGKLDSNAILANEGVDCVTDGLIDLRVLVPTYVAEIPKDSGLQFGIGENIFYKTANAADQDRTGYLVGINTTNNKVSIVAKNSGLGELIVLNPITVEIGISGDPTLGSTITSTISGGNVYNYQWKRDGVNIPGATENTYVTIAEDETKIITVELLVGSDILAISNEILISTGEISGSLWAWGQNNYGQIGDGTTSYRIIPVRIGTDTNWKAVYSSYSSSYAIKEDGSLWGWGQNNNGTIGDGTVIQTNVPVRIGTDNNWEDITGGFTHTIGIKVDGSLWGWGQNSSGQIGDGSTLYKYNPVRIGTGTDWKKIPSISGSHTIVIR